jgi:hypothetical protein
MRRTNVHGIDNQLPQPAIPEGKPGPQQRSHVAWEQDVSQHRITDPHVGERGAAQETGQQHRAKNRGARSQVHQQAEQLQYPDASSEAHGDAQPRQGLYHRPDAGELDAAVEQQKGDGQTAEDPSGPTNQAG